MLERMLDAAARARVGLAAAAILAATAMAAHADAPDPQDIVQRADLVRFPRESFQVDVAIRSSAPGREPDARRLRVLSKGNESAVVLTTEPASERGQALLMRGRDLWIFMPNVSQPIRLSLSQRLTGQVANGDIARANFSGDYTPSLVRTEDCGGEACFVLELRANERSVTYHRVLYWVAQKGYRPVRAEFYAVSERLLKTARFGGYRQLGERVRPTEVVIEDAIKEGETSVLNYSDLRPRDLPDKVFTKDYLKRLEF